MIVNSRNMCIRLLKILLCICHCRGKRKSPVRPANALGSTFNSSVSIKENRFLEVQTLMNQLAASQRNSRVSEPSSCEKRYLRRNSMPADPKFYHSMMSRHSSVNSGNLSVDEYKDVGGVLILDLQLREGAETGLPQRNARRRSSL